MIHTATSFGTKLYADYLYKLPLQSQNQVRQQAVIADIQIDDSSHFV